MLRTRAGSVAIAAEGPWRCSARLKNTAGRDRMAQCAPGAFAGPA